MSLAEITTFEVRPLAGRIGGEVRGLDLSVELPDRVLTELRAALVAHKVLFFRGQRLDAASQQAFASRWGRLTTAHPTVPGLDTDPAIYELDSIGGARANHWHTDVTFTDRPPMASVLRAVVLPSHGGDTIWANTATAYQDLPESLARLADGLRAVHTNVYDYAEPKASDAAVEAHRAVFRSVRFETEHPVVRVHPESGERSLLIGGFAQRIRGLDSTASTDLLRTLQSYVTRPENTVRWHWKLGDVAMWDNRSTQHYAVADYGDAHRRMHRVTISGPVPVGVDGRPSVALVGDASDYSPVGSSN